MKLRTFLCMPYSSTYCFSMKFCPFIVSRYIKTDNISWPRQVLLLDMIFIVSWCHFVNRNSLKEKQFLSIFKMLIMQGIVQCQIIQKCDKKSFPSLRIIKEKQNIKLEGHCQFLFNIYIKKNPILWSYHCTLRPCEYVVGDEKLHRVTHQIYIPAQRDGSEHGTSIKVLWCRRVLYIYVQKVFKQT